MKGNNHEIPVYSSDLLLKPAQVYCRKRNTKFSDVWTGQYATYAVATTGEVYAWGLNNYYQLGSYTDSSFVVGVAFILVVVGLIRIK